MTASATASTAMVVSLVATHIVFEVLNDVAGPYIDTLEDVHLSWSGTLLRPRANDVDQDVVVDLFRVIRCEGRGFPDQVDGEPLDDLLVFMIHDVDQTAVESHEHLLCPDAIGLFHGQEPSHPVGRVEHIILRRHCEGGQVLQDVGR
jgi:hypothetical protein